LVPQNSGGLNDLKIENSKNHTFASDLEDSPSIQGLTGTNLPQLPPIFMPNKKGQKKKSNGANVLVQNSSSNIPNSNMGGG
jgi:hypothetical protein